MSLKQINGKVISYCAIPNHLRKDHWISKYPTGCYVECHIEEEPDDEDLVSKWILENYPELKDETFYIEIDY